MKKFISFVMSMLFVLMLGCFAVQAPNSHCNAIDSISTSISTDSLTIPLTSINEEVQRLSQTRSQLFASTFDYISQNSKVDGTSKRIIAEKIVEVALEHNIDICFILAQGHIETHIGTYGIGRTRHSIFGVYRTYKSYKDCIDDYIRILNKNYLTKGRTEYDLMKKYVTTGGSRYAGNPNYEQSLSNKYFELKNSTNIYELQQLLKDCNERDSI